MSTRFSSWRNTEYVGLPTDYYMQALQMNEQRAEQQVQGIGQMLQAIQQVDALGPDAKAYRDQIINEYQTDVASIAKMNLKTPDALTKIGAVLGNRSRAEGLKNIAYMRAMAGKKAAEAEAYRKEFGNDVNTLPFQRAYQKVLQGTGDPSKFDPHVFDNIEILKYRNASAEALKMLEKKIGNKTVYTTKNGMATIVRSVEELSPAELMKATREIIEADPGLMNQMRLNAEYEAFKRGLDLPTYGRQLFDIEHNKFLERKAQADLIINNKEEVKKQLQASNPGRKITDVDVQKYIDNYKDDVKVREEQFAKYNTENVNGNNDIAFAINNQILKEGNAVSTARAYRHDEFKGIEWDQEALARLKASLHYKNMKKLQDEEQQRNAVNFTVQDIGAVATKAYAASPEILRKRVLTGDYVDDMILRYFDSNKEDQLAKDLLPTAKHSKASSIAEGMNPSYFAVASNEAETIQKTRRKKAVDLLAEKFGYNPQTGLTKEQYLQGIYMTEGSNQKKGVVARNLNTEKYVTDIINTMPSLSVWKNGKELAPRGSDQEARGILVEHLTKNKNNIGALTFTSNVSKNNQKGVMTTQFVVGKDVYEIEVPQNFVQNSGALGRVLATANQGHSVGVKPGMPDVINLPEIVKLPDGTMQSVSVPYFSSRLATGSSNLTYFSYNPYANAYAKNQVLKVAFELANADKTSFPQLSDDAKTKYVNRATKLINDAFDTGVLETDGVSPSQKVINLPNGKTMNLDVALHIANKRFTNWGDFQRNITAGTSDREFAFPGNDGKGYRTSGLIGETTVLNKITSSLMPFDFVDYITTGKKDAQRYYNEPISPFD